MMSRGHSRGQKLQQLSTGDSSLLMQRLRDPAWSVRLHAVRSLAGSADASSALSMALELLGDEDVGVRVASVKAVETIFMRTGRLEGVVKEATRRLLEMTGDREEHVRSKASNALQNILTLTCKDPTFIQSLFCAVKNEKESTVLKRVVQSMFADQTLSSNNIADTLNSIFDNPEASDATRILTAEMSTMLALWKMMRVKEDDLRLVSVKSRCKYTRSMVLELLIWRNDRNPSEFREEYLQDLLRICLRCYDIANIIQVVTWFSNHSFHLDFMLEFVEEILKEGCKFGGDRFEELVQVCARYLSAFDKLRLWQLSQNSSDLPDYVVVMLKKLSAEMAGDLDLLISHLKRSDFHLRLNALCRVRHEYARRGLVLVERKVFKDCSPQYSGRNNCVLDVVRWALRLQDDTMLLRRKFDLLPDDEIKLEDEEVWSRMELSLDCNICIIDGLTLRMVRGSSKYSQTIFVAVMNGHAYGVEEEVAWDLLSAPSECDERLTRLYELLLRMTASEDSLFLFASSVLAEVVVQGDVDLTTRVLGVCREKKQDNRWLRSAVNLLASLAPLNHAPSLKFLESLLSSATDDDLCNMILVTVALLTDKQCNSEVCYELLKRLIALRMRLGHLKSFEWTLCRLIDALKGSDRKAREVNRRLAAASFKRWSQKITTQINSSSMREAQTRTDTSDSEAAGLGASAVDDLYAMLLSKNFDITDRSLKNFELDADLHKKREVLARIFEKLKPDDYRMTKIAVDELDHSDSQIREIAVSALEKVNASHKIAILTKLVSMLKSKHACFQNFAATHLKRQSYKQYPFIYYALKEV